MLRSQEKKRTVDILALEKKKGRRRGFREERARTSRTMSRKISRWCDKESLCWRSKEERQRDGVGKGKRNSPFVECILRSRSLLVRRRKRKVPSGRSIRKNSPHGKRVNSTSIHMGSLSRGSAKRKPCVYCVTKWSEGNSDRLKKKSRLGRGGRTKQKPSRCEKMLSLEETSGIKGDIDLTRYRAAEAKEKIG